MSGQLRFAVLGPVRAWRGDRELKLGPPQQRAVLAVLLLRENAQVSVSDIIDALWADDMPSSAEHVIRSYIYRLRKVLGAVDSADVGSSGGVGSSVIASVGHGYLLATGPDSLDLATFREGLSSAQEATRAGEHAKAVMLLDDALGLWRGSALAGVPGEFAETQRIHLDQLRLTALEAKAVAQVEAGAYGDAEVLLDQLTAEHPLNERFRELRMLALYRYGRQSDALNVYRQTQDLLAEELGVDPGPGLRALHERILRGDPTLLPSRPFVAPVVPEEREPEEAAGAVVVQEQVDGAVRPVQLPAGLRGFVGRQGELKRAEGFLECDETEPVVVVTGMAGVGKTAFAVHWAHRIADRFPDGQIYLNLRGFDPARPTLTVQEALTALFDSLGVRASNLPNDVDRQAAYLRSLVAGKRLLILLDNVRDAEQVRPLLPGGKTCLVIVTSRNQLRGLSVHDGAGMIELDVLSSQDALHLLDRRLGPAHLQDSAELAEIAERCGRLPLAIAVVAARVATAPHFPLSAALAELRDQQGVLDAFMDVDAVVDVRSVFSWSLQAVSEPAAELFQLMALHRAMSCDESAAASLIGRPLPLVRRLLGELLTANLVFAGEPGRYMYHDLVRLYAAELAADLPAGLRRAAIHRLLDHYTTSAQNADFTINPHRPQVDPIEPLDGVVVLESTSYDEAFGWFATEHEPLLAAMSLAVDEGFDEHVWRLARVLDTFLYRTGRWRQSLASDETGLAAADRLGDRVLQARFHTSLGRGHVRLKQYQEAHAHLVQAIAMFEEEGEIDRAASGYATLATLASDRGDAHEAIRLYRQALELTEEPVVRAMAINNLGNAYSRLGDHGQALTLSLESLRLWGEVGDRHGEANAWDSVGHAHQMLGHQAKAVRAYRHSIAMFAELGDQVNEATTLINLGDSLIAADNPDGARDAWTHALELLAGLDDAAAAKVRERLSDHLNSSPS
ncbi:BTAD domain-containing putative transcriptional regulator [Kribbella sp. NPDC051770]|uniref:AfsR/SARP family transcriptional regulator n=1 Tax=Kribbella sp. NPDC051770 TaxID=3155413 RepID=UPI0034269D6F